MNLNLLLQRESETQWVGPGLQGQRELTAAKQGSASLGLRGPDKPAASQGLSVLSWQVET